MDSPNPTWMRRALELAERGRGFVEPNPLVGAVLVRDNKIVGEGLHQRFGEVHAEINALGMAGDKARGATLYVTLEPCCHHGKTPPCTDALIRARVGHVVAAMLDPFPQVAGKGVELLRAAGITVETGLCEPEARSLNAPYLKLLATGKPYVHAKWAMSLDGKMATRTGDSRWISNEASRKRVHELRGRMDAVIVGIGTVLADDPLLTARPPGPRTACRVILDSRGRLPLSSQLVATARSVPTMVVTTTAAGERVEALRSAGCEVLTLPTVRAGSVSDGPALPQEAAPSLTLPARTAIDSLLTELGRRRWTNVLVEGGSAVLGSFCDAGAIDEVHVFIAPRLIGGSTALSPVGGVGCGAMAQVLSLTDCEIEIIEGDCYLHGKASRAP